MFAFIINVIIILIVMKVFFKFMYPKPPKAFFAQAGDDTSLRRCAHCGHELATYRGILLVDGVEVTKKTDDTPDTANELFFCNDEHRQGFFAERGEKG